VFILGATTLQDFGLALLIGLLVGSYSSLFIAAPVLARLKEREPRYAAIRQRLESRPGSGGPLTPAAAAAGRVSSGGGTGRQVPAGVGAQPESDGGSRPRTNRGSAPRPRKKGRRR